MNRRTGILAILIALAPVVQGGAAGERMDAYQIGSHGQADIQYPAWFKTSLLDLRDDLDDARQAGKRGIILFLSQKQCNHCKAFIDTTMNDPATQKRITKAYDVIALDIFSDLELTDIDGTALPVRDFAEHKRARLTPTLLFYGIENTLQLRIIGFYPPEKFNRVLDYLEAGLHRHEQLSQYLQRSQAKPGQHAQALQIDYTLFARPPHNLGRSTHKGKRPLLVVFDQPGCNPCRRFHQRVLGDTQVRNGMPDFDRVLLDMTDDTTRLIVPDGRQLTPRQWARELQLTYDIAVVFFDEDGKEVHRLDAETGRDRMTGSMQYVLQKAYLRHEQFLRWRKEQAFKRNQGGKQ